MRVLCNSLEQMRKIVNNQVRVANLQFEIWFVGQRNLCDIYNYVSNFLFADCFVF